MMMNLKDANEFFFDDRSAILYLNVKNHDDTKHSHSVVKSTNAQVERNPPIIDESQFFMWKQLLLHYTCLSKVSGI